MAKAPRTRSGPSSTASTDARSGTTAGYNYSEANKKSGIVWSDATFLEYIKDPKAKIPGTKMVFAGIKNESEAKNLWAFLAQFKADGKK